ncbi:unnamed protein product [Adineta ricciae]|uniref:Uncharacterized protein n=1 Tax=Adineta ricciae TaxID=249248 RepID=A0A814BTT9_ADIRI|nr:unnamed protein product [Adineta ricciae]CAF0984731.1 unnamed protein product [Adineta ricciae]
MASAIASNRCSICEKNAAMCNCVGCQAFFCIKHFNEHRQQLSLQYDQDVIEPCDRLVEQINQAQNSNDTSFEHFVTIDQWEASTMDIVKRTANRAREQLTRLLDDEKELLRKQFDRLTQEIRRQREEDEFAEEDITRFRTKINKLQQALQQSAQPNNINVIASQLGQVDWNHLIYVEKQPEKILPRSTCIDFNAQWIKDGLTVAGGNGRGEKLNQLNAPQGICVDNDDQSVYITDWCNHRIVRWKPNQTAGQIVAGGNGAGSGPNQLNNPLDVILDHERNNFIICDSGNKRIVRWPCRDAHSGQTIISNIDSRGLAIDDRGYLYVSDYTKNEVRRWQIGEVEGTLVAGGNGRGRALNQLNGPQGIFVDEDHSIYVSDMNNYRVMKWTDGAKEGTIVAGGQSKGDDLTQLSSPYGVVVDRLGTVYIVDCGCCRIVRWCNGSKAGSIVVGGNGCGDKINQLNYPTGFAFDRFGNIYVSDNGNNRIQKFNIYSNSC